MNTNTLDTIIAAASKSLAGRSPVEADTRESLALIAIVNLALAAISNTTNVSASIARAETCIRRIRETLPEETIESILNEPESD